MTQVNAWTLPGRASALASGSPVSAWLSLPVTNSVLVIGSRSPCSVASTNTLPTSDCVLPSLVVPWTACTASPLTVAPVGVHSRSTVSLPLATCGASSASSTSSHAFGSPPTRVTQLLPGFRFFCLRAASVNVGRLRYRSRRSSRSLR